MRPAKRPLVRRFTGALAWVAGVGVGLLMLPTVVDVAYRLTFGPSVPGLLEYSEVGLVIVVFLGMAAALERRAHIHTPVLTSRLPPSRAHVLRFIGLLVVWALLIALIAGTAQDALDSFAIREYRFGLTEVPVWPAKAAIPIGLVALWLEATFQLVQHLRSGRAPAATPAAIAARGEASRGA